MEKYLQQLLQDLQYATEHVSWPYPEKESVSLGDWISEEEEEKTAPRIQLEEWTGIQQAQFPPAHLLTDAQIDRLYQAIDNMLTAHNYHATFMFSMPTRTKYQVVRQHFQQEAIQKEWHMGFFELCFTNTSHPDCLMGEACHCAYFEEMSKNWIEDTRTPEEQRAAELEIELQYLRRKYGDEYMKYYPYHLDPEYDDEEGNPFDYGFGDEDDEEEDDQWWRK
ncbi:MAG: hypothetical protein AAGJ18_06105 [Bacteroidota bacterium]